MPGSVERFADEARILVKSGNGGNGIVSFRHEKFVPFGGPDGGDGGRGGDVILRGQRNLDSLERFQHEAAFRADNGGSGKPSKQHGKRGADIVIEVPLGTIAYDDSGIVADVIEDGETVHVARGGKGGIGNVHFATSTNRAPRMARKGEPGEECWLRLELRTIGDVGIAGEPNAGKSSLLAAMTAALPAVGDYPFTTLAPNLGVAVVADLPFVVVDIPGLIEGAHTGRGLGLQFLRHISRARMLVHIVDAAGPDPVGSYRMIRSEMEQYDPALLDKPTLAVANKLDLDEAKRVWPTLRRALREHGADEVYGVSALTGEGVTELQIAIRRRLDAIAAVKPVSPVAEVRTYRLAPDDGPFTVHRKGDWFEVTGRETEKIVSMANMETSEGIDDLQRQLERLGLFKELERAGVKPGDSVRIGAFELEWT
ncbi:MAG: obg [Chloroflexi bacterium]|nr:obg [Chloroflexota bacterium]